MLAGAGVGVFHQAAGIQAQGEAAFDIGLLLQQHAPHVGVLDDTYLRRKWVLAVGQASLWPLAGVVQGMQVALVAQAGRAQADTDAGFVHQLEHVAQALAWLADQIADRAVAFAEIQYCRGGVAIAHLV
ncbi:hypothetical protein D9M71_138610 [compost metagenome]